MKNKFQILMLLLLFGFISQKGQAQQKPDFNKTEPFSVYSKKMDEYYMIKGIKAPGYKLWKRMQWYQEARLAPDGKIPDATQLKLNAMEQTSQKAKAVTANQSDLFLASWAPLGPGAVTSSNGGIGRINRITFHPTNASIFFVSTAGGGLWKTTNGGTSWTSLTDGLPDINTIGLAINYNSVNTMYLLSGDADSYFSGARGCCGFGRSSNGVYKTTDGGITWNFGGLNFADSDGFLPYNIKMHPTNPSILLVASRSGIYRTTNAGSTWAQVLHRVTYDIEFKPGNASVVYASGNDSIYRSTDGGFSWAGVFELPTDLAGRCELAVTPADPNYIYALSGSVSSDEFKFRGLFKSVNGGNSFTLVRNSPNILGGDLLGIDHVDQSDYDLSIAADPLDKNHIITGGVYLWESLDGGANISIINPTNKYHSDIHNIAFNPLSPTVMYHSSDGGIYRFKYADHTWSNLNTTLGISQYYRISTAQTNSYQLTGGAQDNGTHMRKFASSSFDEVIGADGMDNIISPTNANIIYGSTQNSNLYKSRNNGSTFTKIVDWDTDLEPKGIFKRWMTPLALNPTNSDIIYMGTRPIVRVMDLAGNIIITKLNNEGLAGHVLKVAPSDANTLYVAQNGIEFYANYIGTIAKRSNDAGTTWTEIYGVQANRQFISDIAVNPTNSSEIWATFGGYEEGIKVYKSTNAGNSWTNITGSLPNVPVNCIVYKDNNGNPDDAIYIGTDIGVFYRDNILGDWIPFSNGLPVVEVTDLEIQVSSGKLRAGTYGRGMWETALYTASCVANYTFTSASHTPSTPYFYQASNTITSTAAIVGAGAKVNYRAGGHIILKPGFSISTATGARFNGIIGSCSTGIVPPGNFRNIYNGLKGVLVR